MRYKEFKGLIYVSDEEDTYVEDQIAYYSTQTGGTVIFDPIKEESEDGEM